MAEPRIVFVTNMCPHYRVRTFETLATYCHAKFYFYSAGKEWYWQTKHGVRAGCFEYEYLRGFSLVGTRVTPALISRLLFDQLDVVVKCINGRFALPASYLAARLRGKPFILWTGIWMSLQTPIHRLIFPLTRFIYRNSDAVVVYGEHVQRYLLSQGVAAEKIFVAPHAIENEKYNRSFTAGELRELRDKLGISENQRVILYLGRLEPSKGVTHLIDAYRQLRSNGAVLLLAGDGAERNQLCRRVTDLGISDTVRFVGYVPPEQAAAYYALAFVTVLPSITTSSGKEPWGLVVNEAMNQGCPVVATDAVGAAAGGLIQEGVNGFVVAEGNSSELAGALQRLFDQPELRDRLGVAARKTISQWDNERMVAGFRAAIDYVLAKRASLQATAEYPRPSSRSAKSGSS